MPRYLRDDSICCGNCYGMGPENAITKLGPGKRFAIDYDYCKGCGICVAECSRRCRRDGSGAEALTQVVDFGPGT
jgi:Pyruvate/2-oxoacid:ferredoxin oxidoreductase delta subunit